MRLSRCTIRKENTVNITKMDDQIIIDVRGELCPTPVIETKKISDAYPYEEIITIVDNDISKENVEKFGKSKGYAVITNKQGRDYFIVLTPRLPGTDEEALQRILTKHVGENNHKLDEPKERTTSTPERGQTVESHTLGIVRDDEIVIPDITENSHSFQDASLSRHRIILVTKDYLGEGSEELGRTLMKTFWNCLVEADTYPKAIYFINSAVKMVCVTSDYIDVLKQLVTAGVDIAACGICLNYYGLTDCVAVGTITNMYTITESIVGEDIVTL